jgi:hypothetical protein
VGFGFGWKIQTQKNPESKLKKISKILEIQNPNPNSNPIFFWTFKFKIH